MSADEIRNTFNPMIAIGPPATSEARQADIHLMMVAEIAAQLAELNATLKAGVPVLLCATTCTIPVSVV